jgi:hypothetical protein
MKLSVCLLTRNEEKTIAEALASVDGVADEIIVVDTASTDATARIAVEMGAKVHQFDWNDSFAAGRNFTVQLASCEWILWLNAYEKLLPACHEELRACLERPDAFGYSVLVRSSNAHQGMAQVTDVADLRLFRSRPDLLFVGRLHPHFDAPFLETLTGEGQSVWPSNIVLLSKASPDRADSKLTWVARLLELELRDRPGQLHYLIEYGRVLLRLKDARAPGILAQAADQVMAVRDSPTPPNNNVQMLLEHLLSPAADQTFNRASQDEIRELAQRWFPRSPRLIYLCAQHYFDKGDFQKAATLLTSLRQLGQTGAYDRSISFPSGLISDDALFNLASCYRRLDQLEMAEQCYESLLQSERYQVEASAELATVRHLLINQKGLGFSFHTSEGSM